MRWRLWLYDFAMRRYRNAKARAERWLAIANRVRPPLHRPVPPYRGRWPDRDLCGND